MRSSPGTATCGCRVAAMDALRSGRITTFGGSLDECPEGGEPGVPEERLSGVAHAGAAGDGDLRAAREQSAGCDAGLDVL